MTHTLPVRRYFRLGVVLALAGTGLARAGAAADPAKVVGHEPCKECHQSEVTAWEKTHHARSFDALREGTEIATKLGLERTFRREGLCLKCHATTRLEGDAPRAAAGVSCESCHGAAKDWVRVHNDFGGPGVTREQEPAAHRAERWSKAEAAGMLRPSDLYAVAANCFGCHTVPEQELVNKGGHKAGSEFDLVAYSQGEVRHNYLASKGQHNAEASAARKRVLHVVGKALDLEFALRGIAKVTERGEYSSGMVRRAKAAFKALAAAAEAGKLTDLSAALGQLPKDEAGELKPGIATAAEHAGIVAAAARKFAASNDGASLGALDALLAPAATYKGQAAP